MVSNGTINTFRCEVCGRKFKKKGTADKHCLNGPWVCPNCGEAIKHISNIARHRKICANPKAKSETVTNFECDECDSSFKLKHLLVRHKRKAHNVAGIGIFSCQVEGCTYSSNYAHQVKKHTTLKHSSGDLFKCASCPYSCSSEGGLRRHFLRRHDERSCTVCLEVCPSKIKLKEHLKNNEACRARN